MAEGRVRGFSVATKCVTVDDLIEKFRDRVDATSILVNPVEHRDVGTECAFAILLADRKPAIAGTCVVLEVYRDGNNPFKRPGMRLEIKRLGPESQRVFSELVAKRIPPRKMTTMFPVVAPPPEPPEPAPVVAVPAISAPATPVIVMPRAARAKTEAPRTKTHSDVVAPRPVVSTSQLMPRTSTSTLGSRSAVAQRIQQRVTQPIRGLREEARAASPALEEPLVRAPRATPFDFDNAKVGLSDKAAPVAAPLVETQPLIAPQPVQPKPALARVETRTPHSPFILPANPLAQLTDASLEGFVDCRLFDAAGRPPQEFPAGTVDLDEQVTVRDSVETAKLVAAEAVLKKSQLGEPLPLPPPPQSLPGLPPMSRAEPLPYAATKLPDLATNANDRLRMPILKTRVRNQLLLAIALVPLLGAAAVVGYMRLVATPASTPMPAGPATIATLEQPELARVAIEAPPAAADEPVAPAGKQPIHAVLVKSYPIAARVTVGQRYFGTTPTYVKIPANTPVEIVLQRPGFKRVTYPMTSKQVGGRVFVRLVRRGGR